MDTILIRRSPLTEEVIGTRDDKSKVGLRGICKERVKRCCDKDYLKKIFFEFFPVIHHLLTYQWKTWLLNDIIAGISASALHVPQGLGFALLAGVAPVYGLYVSFVPAWIYYIFGSSRHLSIGATAVTALMVGSYVNGFDYKGMVSFNNETTWSRWNDSEEYDGGEGMDEKGMSEEMLRVNAASLLTLATGIIQIIMWIFNLSRMSQYMSTPFVKSFIAGCSAHIIVNQLPFQLGISINPSRGFFKLPILLYRICQNLPSTNLPSFITSIICMTFLFVMRFAQSFEKVKRLKIPLPVDLFLVVVSIIISHFLRLNQRFGIKIVGTFSSGFPSFHAPSLNHLPPTISTSSSLQPDTTTQLLYTLITAAIIVAIINYVFNITMATLMAERNGYEIDGGQEMMAYGIYNIISSFFCCHVSAQAPPRTLILETSKAYSQLASLISTILPLMVAMFAGPLVKSLPICVLGTIISVSLIPLFLTECWNIRTVWKISRRDFVVWVVCFLSTVFVDLFVGLVVGMLVNGWMVLVGMRNAKWVRLERYKDTELFCVKKDFYDENGDIKEISSLEYDSNNYPSTNCPSEATPEDKSNHNNNPLVLKFGISLNYSNASQFKNNLMEEVRKNFDFSSSLETSDDTKSDGRNKRMLILDFSCVNDIDITGLNKLQKCFEELEKMMVVTVLCSCPPKAKNKLYLFRFGDRRNFCGAVKRVVWLWMVELWMVV